MPQEISTNEVIQPEDFAVFGGYAFKDGKQLEHWIEGPQVVTDFGMELDNVTVDDAGMLHAVPIKKAGICGGFHCEDKRWARSEDLTRRRKPVPAQSKEATALHLRINEIIALIPRNFPKRADMIAALEDRQGSIPYTALGAMSCRFQEVSQILGDCIPENADWGSKVAEVFGKGID